MTRLSNRLTWPDLLPNRSFNLFALRVDAIMVHMPAVFVGKSWICIPFYFLYIHSFQFLCHSFPHFDINTSIFLIFNSISSHFTPFIPLFPTPVRKIPLFLISFYSVLSHSIPFNSFPLYFITSHSVFIPSLRKEKIHKHGN